MKPPRAMLISCYKLISLKCFPPPSPRTSEQTRHQTNGVGLLSASLSRTQPHTHTHTQTAAAGLCSLARARVRVVTVSLAACSWRTAGRAAADQREGDCDSNGSDGASGELRSASSSDGQRPQSPIDGAAPIHTSHSTRTYDSTDASPMVCTDLHSSRRCGWRR